MPEGLTSTERAANTRQVKRYKAERRKRGTCCACVHRCGSVTVVGKSICKIGESRQHPQCETDGKGPRFEFDPSVMDQFRDRR
jgi:hypothetical protein